VYHNRSTIGDPPSFFPARTVVNQVLSDKTAGRIDIGVRKNIAASSSLVGLRHWTAFDIAID
jgi:hypothetical protein